MCKLQAASSALLPCRQRACLNRCERRCAGGGEETSVGYDSDRWLHGLKYRWMTPTLAGGGDPLEDDRGGWVHCSSWNHLRSGKRYSPFDALTGSSTPTEHGWQQQQPSFFITIFQCSINYQSSAAYCNILYHSVWVHSTVKT